MGWKEDVWSCAQALPAEFSLNDMYAFAADLGRTRANNNVPAKIRQQLQELRDDGLLDFIGPGRYRHAQPDTATQWPYKPGAKASRAELAELLGLQPGGLDRKGMHKNAQGRFSRDLILIHEAGTNPYQDELVDEARFTWIGMGTAKKGDQKYEGFNRYLAEHVELGINVHFFIRPSSNSPELDYHGEYVLQAHRYTLRETEDRRVFEYDLERASGAPQRAAVGALYEHSWERPPEPYVVDARRRVKIVDRPARDRAFSLRLRAIYGDECAACGEPLVGREPGSTAARMDLAGAHVRYVSDGGPDEINNGICLCNRHHWAFDHGVFSLDDDHRIRICQDAADPHGELLEGERISVPAESALRPHPTYLRWHRKHWGVALN